MGQLGSKSSAERRALLQRLVPGGETRDVSLYGNTHDHRTHCSSLCIYPWDFDQTWSPWQHGPGHHNPGGLVYVVDNPTGGVWVKPKDGWSRW
ncbi:unnamed protein product [Merluccius merluccius]